MKVTSIIFSLAIATSSLVTAETTLPQLSTSDLWGFVNLDPDGVLRSWSSSGTCISMREGRVAANITEHEKSVLASVNELSVSDEQLFNPAEDIRPSDMIATSEASRLADSDGFIARPRIVLQERACVPAYCPSATNAECIIYIGCEACYASVYWGLMGSG